MAGRGDGRTKDVGLVFEAATALARGVDRRVELAETCADPRSILVVEPLRWALELRPVWMAWEQVPPVLEFWEGCAGHLRAAGYDVWTGLLSSEQYGVPQTRRRAILLAARDGRPVGMPRPTHRRYLPPRKLDPDALGLFDAAEYEERRTHPEDDGLLPWVSMAEALGWLDGDVPGPAPTVSAGGTGSGGGVEVFASREARERAARSVLVGFPRRADTESNKSAGVVEIDGEEYRERDLRAASEPAQVVTEKSRSWMMRMGNQSNATVRDIDEPAPTLLFGHRANAVEFVPGEVVDTGNTRGGSRPEGRSRDVSEPAVAITSRADQLEVRGDAPTHYDRRQVDGRTGIPVRRREVDEPAPTITGEANGAWVHARPATTVAGDPRVHPPGHKRNADDEAAGRDHYEGRAGENAVRVTVEQAAALQSFPAGYPWQGSRSAQYRQIGNAVPPLMAAAVLSSIADVEPNEEGNDGQQQQ